MAQKCEQQQQQINNCYWHSTLSNKHSIVKINIHKQFHILTKFLSTMSGTFLQPFLESIQTLPCNLKRNFNLIGDLDEKANGIY